MTEPLRLSFQVDCPAEHAFDVWATQISRWWPAHHTMTGEAGRVVLETGVGGRIFERTRAGDELDWGTVTIWESPRRLGYSWHLHQDRSDATDVEITFIDNGDSTTRVEIEHRGWERLGARGPGRREANLAGWSSLLPHFAAACASSVYDLRPGGAGRD